MTIRILKNLAKTFEYDLFTHDFTRSERIDFSKTFISVNTGSCSRSVPIFYVDTCLAFDSAKWTVLYSERTSSGRGFIQKKKNRKVVAKRRQMQRGIDKTPNIDASYHGNAVNLLTAIESRVYLEFTPSNQRIDSAPFNVTVYTPDTLG